MQLPDDEEQNQNGRNFRRIRNRTDNLCLGLQESTQFFGAQLFRGFWH